MRLSMVSRIIKAELCVIRLLAARYFRCDVSTCNNRGFLDEVVSKKDYCTL
jgi:hypothetical protein